MRNRHLLQGLAELQTELQMAPFVTPQAQVSAVQKLEELIQLAQLQDEVESLRLDQAGLRTRVTEARERQDDLQEEIEELRGLIESFEDEKRYWDGSL